MRQTLIDAVARRLECAKLTHAPRADLAIEAVDTVLYLMAPPAGEGGLAAIIRQAKADLENAAAAQDIEWYKYAAMRVDILEQVDTALRAASAEVEGAGGAQSGEGLTFDLLPVEPGVGDFAEKVYAALTPAPVIEAGTADPFGDGAKHESAVTAGQALHAQLTPRELDTLSWVANELRGNGQLYASEIVEKVVLQGQAPDLRTPVPSEPETEGDLTVKDSDGWARAFYWRELYTKVKADRDTIAADYNALATTCENQSERIQALQAALRTAPSGKEREGWVTVPREPTPEMIAAGTAGRKAVESILAEPNTRATYDAMIAASPEPSRQEGEL